MSKGAKHVLMVGSALELPGGISEVVKHYQSPDLCERWALRFVVSYRGKGMLVQLRTMLLALLRVLGHLWTRQVWLVHVHSASRGSFWRKSMFCGTAWLFRVPYIFHLHSGEFAHFFSHECGGLARMWVRWVLRHAARVIVLTPGWCDAIHQIEPAARTSVLVNPIALPDAANPVKEPATRVLFLGRLRPSKGVFDLVQAVALVLVDHPHVRFCLAGDGDRAALRDRAEQLGVGHALEMPGWIDGDAKSSELSRADVLTLPSYFEGLPICVLEAMALGVPVVATRVGGVPFALDEGRCGVLVPAGDPCALAKGISALLGDPLRRHALSLSSRQRAREHFSPDRVVHALSQIWQACIDSDGSRPLSHDKECGQ